MVVLIAIEGATGNARNDPAWSGSYMDELSKKWNPALARYIQGPQLGPGSVENTADLALAYADSLCSVYRAKGLILAGYSLGGAAAVLTAHKLHERGIPVDFLALYDGIDPFFKAVTVPSNVAAGVHVLRSGNSGSRPYWPKCARIGNIQEHALNITHWGASGVLLKQGIPAGRSPNDFVEEDDLRGVPYDTAVTWGGDLAAAGRMWAIMQSQIDAAYASCMSRPRGPAHPQPGTGGTFYAVQAGDSLSLIAGRFWQDRMLWPLIQDRNQSKVGANPNAINVGVQLLIPDIDRLSPAHLEAARVRGRMGWH